MSAQSFSFKGIPRGELTLPGDKSISHRVLIIGSVCENSFRVKNFSWGKDNLSTLNIMRSLGVKIEEYLEELVINGVGLDGLEEPSGVLNAGNSGTTIRLLTGLLSSQNFYSVITGDKYLRKRPMGRVVKPLKSRGAMIWGRENDNLAPLSIRGRELESFDYKMKISSAQVKSAILLSGLRAKGGTSVTEIAPARDHTERMLKFFGADIEFSYPHIRMTPYPHLKGRDIIIPGDLSSASFFIVLGLLIPHSEIIIKDVLLNPTRTGVIEILREMGANIEVLNYSEEWEPRGDLAVRYSKLKNVEISGEKVVKAIDEIPILAVAGTFAEGEMVVRDASELRVKESDRIRSIVENMRKLGIKVEEFSDGFRIAGNILSKKGKVRISSYGDHRIAMAFAVLGSAVEGLEMEIDDFEMVDISFPQFRKFLEGLYL